MIKHSNLLNLCAGFIFLALCGAFVSCSNTQEDSHELKGEHSEQENSHEQEKGHNEVVQLSDQELAEFAIEIDTAAAGVVRQHRDLTGEIVIDPNRLAHIIPRFPGIVKKVYKKVGDRVRAGEVLAVIESNESLAPYEITSLINGIVIEMHLTLGEAISDNSHDIVVADLSYIWADLNAYQKDLEHLAAGQLATISAGGNLPPFTGKISWISPTLNEARRTATARVIVANPQGQWRPGLFISAAVVTSALEVSVAVPKTALEMFEEQTVIFVKTADGFKPRTVKLGRENHSTVEILEGLAPGDLYVSKGGFTLKAELEKGAFGDGHGH